MLDLPPLSEFILPVSLRPLQKKVCQHYFISMSGLPTCSQLYKELLNKNVESLDAIFRQANSKGKGKAGQKSNMLVTPFTLSTRADSTLT